MNDAAPKLMQKQFPDGPKWAIRFGQFMTMSTRRRGEAENMWAESVRAYGWCVAGRPGRIDDVTIAETGWSPVAA